MSAETKLDDIVETIYCNTAEEFLDYLQPRNRIWLPKTTLYPSWVFRGHSNADWKLEPSAIRENRQSWFQGYKDNYSDLIKTYIMESFEELKRLLSPAVSISFDRFSDMMIQILAEIASVRQFVHIADLVGHPVPEANGEIDIMGLDAPSVVMALRTEIVQSVYHPLTFTSINYAHRIEFALAQHHGIPTKILDWTSKPFVAAFMAAEEILRELPKHDLSLKDLQIAVWAIDTSRLGDTDLSLVTHKQHKISYMFAQGGAFIYDRLANRHFFHDGKWRTFEETLLANPPDNLGERPILRKVVLNGINVVWLLQLLAAEGITRAHLMPTYDNVTETIKLSQRVHVVWG